MLEIIEDLAPGVIVAGKYRLDHVLGQGGMGVVWAAEEVGTGARVAVKLLLRGTNADERERERFVREGRAAMSIAHPNVAKVRAVLESAVGTPFIVMDLLEGESLRALLRRRGALGAAECARILLPVVDAVAAAHAAGIVHRDLKPENVFLVSGTDVRVLDFGIAKVIRRDGDSTEASLTSTGAVLGTPVYMAPEQVFGDEDVDGRADVWALGIVLYECLARRRPTDAEGFGQVLKRITTATLEPLASMRAGLPRPLTRLVDRMLQRDRNARPSLAEARKVLEDVARGDDAEASPLSEPASAPPEGASTTAGVANVSAPPGASPPARRPYWLVPVALAALGGAFVVGRQRAQPAIVAPAPSASPVPSASVAQVASSPKDVDFRSKLDGGAAPAELFGPLAQQVSQQIERRDGAACMRDLDLLDALDPTTIDSHEPKSGWAYMRAQCMMLAGDCEGGKALYARAHDALAPKNLLPSGRQQALDGAVIRYCEGENLSPHDALLRARARLADGISGVRKVTTAECVAWHETEKRTSASEKLGTAADEDARRRLLRTNVTLCLVRAGDCARANQIFRDLWSATDGDERVRRELFEAVVPPTTCAPDR